jgi:hypothetical protein
MQDPTLTAVTTATPTNPHSLRILSAVAASAATVKPHAPMSLHTELTRFSHDLGLPELDRYAAIWEAHTIAGPTRPGISRGEWAEDMQELLAAA